MISVWLGRQSQQVVCGAPVISLVSVALAAQVLVGWEHLLLPGRPGRWLHLLFLIFLQHIASQLVNSNVLVQALTPADKSPCAVRAAPDIQELCRSQLQVSDNAECTRMFHLDIVAVDFYDFHWQ